MNTTELKGKIKEQKGKLKQNIATITDDDSLLVEGKKDELKGKIQANVGKAKEKVHKILKGR